MALVSQVVEILESIAPGYLKYENDKIGLQIGSLQAKVDKILISLEITPNVVKEAKEKNCNLIISHHPLIFRALDNVRSDDFIGSMITDLIRSDISVLVAHTNLDRAKHGVSEVLARILDLQDLEILVPADDIQTYKVVVFVPEDIVQKMITELGNIGAGIIGNYSHCTFRTEGLGTFYPLAGAKPFLGDVGELNQVKEYRLEFVVEQNNLSKVINKMISIHPYEEVAYDVYKLKNAPPGIGFGRIGNLSSPRKLVECIELWEDKLNAKLRIAGDINKTVRRVAVCGGSAAELMKAAKAAGADVYITGDVKHHSAHEAIGLGITIVDAGHAETERLVVPELAKLVKAEIDKRKLDAEIEISKVDTSPWIKL